MSLLNWREKAAFLIGDDIMKQRILLSSPHMGGQEERFIRRAFEENWIAPLGSNVDDFEKALAQRVGVSGACALSAGTAALHLGLVTLGVGSQDTVFVQSLTFAASAYPVVYLGATPVFIDSDPDTWNMSPIALKRALADCSAKSKLPKAIIVVDLYGAPANYEAILPLAEEYGIPVLEDAAEALGSTYKNKPCGSLGKLGVLSFNGNKIITTSGGGALVSDDLKLLQRANFLATQAKEPRPYYFHKEIGYNYRLSNICAGIGLGQLSVLDDRVRRRREIFDRYSSALSSWQGFNMMPVLHNASSNRWLTTLTVNFVNDINDIIQVIHDLDATGIEARPLWRPMHLQPVFVEYPFYVHQEGDRSVAEDLFNHGLCLPSGSNLSDNDVDHVISALKFISAGSSGFH
jgi:pyridoxal phosphate-dependent aminotransferase EpsN